MTDRRAFLKLLAASPLLAGIPLISQALAQTPTLKGIDDLVAKAADALDVFDLEAVAHHNIPPAHWGYLAAGVDGEETLRANQQAFSRYQLHTKRFVDLSKMGMSLNLFGTTYKSPIFLSPLGAQRAFNPEGEIGSARAAASRGHLQILSTVSSIGVEDVIAAHGAPVWFQLYTTDNWDMTVKLVKRAEAAGCPVVAVTVDLPVGRNIESATRLARIDTRRTPLYLLTGEYDYGATPAHAQEVARLVPGAKFQVMKGLGHFPPSENYAALRPYLLPVLDELHAHLETQVPATESKGPPP